MNARRRRSTKLIFAGLIIVLGACSDSRATTGRGREIQRLCLAALAEARSARDTLAVLTMGDNGLRASFCADEVLRPHGAYRVPTARR